jgi:hypothetical protein
MKNKSCINIENPPEIERKGKFHLRFHSLNWNPLYFKGKYEVLIILEIN